MLASLATPQTFTLPDCLHVAVKGVLLSNGAFGHVDLFYAQDADDLVWSPIYQWLSTHKGE